DFESEAKGEKLGNYIVDSLSGYGFGPTKIRIVCGGTLEWALENTPGAHPRMDDTNAFTRMPLAPTSSFDGFSRVRTVTPKVCPPIHWRAGIDLQSSDRSAIIGCGILGTDHPNEPSDAISLKASQYVSD